MACCNMKYVNSYELVRGLGKPVIYLLWVASGEEGLGSLILLWRRGGMCVRGLGPLLMDCSSAYCYKAAQKLVSWTGPTALGLGPLL